MTTLKSVTARLALPLVGAPMFIVSGPQLVIAQCKAGIIGSFPSLNARPADQLEAWLLEIRQALAEHDAASPDQLAAPFAVNLIVHRSNDRLDHDLEVCVRHRVPIVITSLGARPEVNDAIHSYGGLVWHDVINDRFARKAVEKGADGVIAVAHGAGGHAGSQSPFALVGEIRRWFDGALLLSGSMATGGAILAALAMGADLAYMGTRFIATSEANAATPYKQMLVDAHADDIVYTSHFSGVKGNYLKPSIVAAGLDPDALAERDPSSMNMGSDDRPKAWRDIWSAGQGTGLIDAVASAAQVVEELRQQYQAARGRLL